MRIDEDGRCCICDEDINAGLCDHTEDERVEHARRADPFHDFDNEADYRYENQGEER